MCHDSVFMFIFTFRQLFLQHRTAERCTEQVFCSTADMFPAVSLTNRQSLGYLQGRFYSLLQRGRNIRYSQVTPKGFRPFHTNRFTWMHRGYHRNTSKETCSKIQPVCVLETYGWPWWCNKQFDIQLVYFNNFKILYTVIVLDFKNLYNKFSLWLYCWRCRI